ncbi:MAG: hypothetical protein ACXWNJ_00420 [Vulcanimicrobiaceae bacterium]
MTHLYQRVLLQCPYHRARLFLQKTIEEAAIGGRREVLELRLPLGERDGSSVEKAVFVTYGRGVDPMHFDEVWTVHWTPAGGGPFPDFDGTLTVRCDEDYVACALELEGDYKPPLGIAGAAFDAIAGARIASSTARALLQQIGAHLQQQYEEEEARKKVPQCDTKSK